MNYPRIIRYESAPGSYEAALGHYMDWRYWGVGMNGHSELGGTLGVCRADGSNNPTADSESNDWRARFEVTVWSDLAHQHLRAMGLPEGGEITLETDNVWDPNNARLDELKSPPFQGGEPGVSPGPRSSL